MRKYVIGIIIGALLMSSGQAIAGTASKVGRKVQAEYVIKVDGVVLDAKALAIDGQTTTPNRALGEAVGYDVAFKNKEVIFTKKVKVIEPVENTDPIVPTRTLEDIIWQIESFKSSIDGYERALKLPTTNEDAKVKTQKLIDEYKQKLSELEAEKAALEAQK